MKHINITVSKKYGREVTSTKNIKKGTIVEMCELLVLSQQDTKLVNMTDLRYYTFVYDKETGQDCLVLGSGEIFNHNEKPNVSYAIKEHNGRAMMIFTATKPIKKGKQLFIDYAADSAVKAQEYVNKNLMAG